MAASDLFRCSEQRSARTVEKHSREFEHSRGLIPGFDKKKKQALKIADRRPSFDSLYNHDN